MISKLPPPLALGLALTLAGCSSSHGGAPDPYPATHAPMPGINDNGGGILAAPKIVTVTVDPSQYTGNTPAAPDTLVFDLQTFDDTLTRTPWWDAVRAGYCEGSICVGPGTAGPHVTLTGANAPSPSGYTDSAGGQTPGTTFQTYVAGLIAGGALPAPDANTIYVFYLPLSVTITLDGSTSCQAFGGYHNTLTVAPAGGTKAIEVPYAVVPICDPPQTQTGVPALTIEQSATLSASHEIIECATDPNAGRPGANASDVSMFGFNITSDQFLPWSLVLQGGEVADLCNDPFGLGKDRWTQGSYVVTRSWSNPSAQASHDPCVPVPAGEVYFNVAPAGANDVLQIPVGKTTTFEADAFSDGPVGDWSVSVVDLNGNVDPFLAGATCDPAQNVACFSVDKATVNNGTKITVTATLNSAPSAPHGSPAGSLAFEPFMIFSQSKATRAFHFWPGVVVAK